MAKLNFTNRKLIYPYKQGAGKNLSLIKLFIDDYDEYYFENDIINIIDPYTNLLSTLIIKTVENIHNGDFF